MDMNDTTDVPDSLDVQPESHDDVNYRYLELGMMFVTIPNSAQTEF